MNRTPSTFPFLPVRKNVPEARRRGKCIVAGFHCGLPLRPGLWFTCLRMTSLAQPIHPGRVSRIRPGLNCHHFAKSESPLKGPNLVGLVILLLAPLTALAAPVDSFNAVWDSPSRDHHGSMPLGNGDIALNAWMTKDGDLHFYISKTDAWDDNARLLKVGKVRDHFDPNPVAAGKAFRQELKLSEGCVEITTPSGLGFR